MGKGFWTDETVRQMVELYKKGWSADRIYREIGAASRSAVLGKLNRLGYGRVQPAVPKKKGKSHPRRNQARKPGAIARLRQGGPRGRPQGPYHPPTVSPSRFAGAFVVPEGADLVAYEDLTPRVCQWPYGDRLPYRFCGGKREEGSPYCAAHRAIATSSKQPGNEEEDGDGDA